jgi:hypothetical protein
MPNLRFMKACDVLDVNKALVINFDISRMKVASLTLLWA